MIVPVLRAPPVRLERGSPRVRRGRRTLPDTRRRRGGAGALGGVNPVALKLWRRLLLPREGNVSRRTVNQVAYGPSATAAGITGARRP